MKRFLGSVQKRIGFLVSIVGLAVVITNLFYRLEGSDILSAISSENVWLLCVLIVPFVISIFIENRVLKFLQAFLFIVSGSISVFQNYSDFYGPGLFLVAWLLFRHYGFLEKRRVFKNILILAVLVILSQVSAFFHNSDGVYAGFSTLLYSLFLSLTLIIVWQDMFEQQKALRKENHSLKIDYKRLSNQLEEIEKEKKPFDLKAYDISPAEERVIKTLTIYKASNREIAERLNITEPTVKLHLYNIYNKIGVDNRFAIIDLCKYNF